MKWTPEAIASLRYFAAEGKSAKQIARILGAPVASTRVYAGKAGISISRAATYEIHAPERELRDRWKDLIGPMKQRLRDDILRAEA